MSRHASKRPRTCSKCDGSENDKPFPPIGSQCSDCLREYNTAYIRNKRGSKPRGPLLTEEQKRQHQKESNKRYRANNPRKSKQSSFTREELAQREIQRLIAEAADYM
jgi:hypothetical protein